MLVEAPSGKLAYAPSGKLAGDCGCCCDCEDPCSVCGCDVFGENHCAPCSFRATTSGIPGAPVDPTCITYKPTCTWSDVDDFISVIMSTDGTHALIQAAVSGWTGEYEHPTATLTAGDFPITIPSIGEDGGTLTLTIECCGDCNTYPCPTSCDCCQWIKFTFPGGHWISFTNIAEAGDPCDYQFTDSDVSSASATLACLDGVWRLTQENLGITNYTARTPEDGCPPIDKTKWIDSATGTADLDNVECLDEECTTCPINCPCLADNNVDPLGFIRFDLDDGSWIQMRVNAVDPETDPCDFKWSNGSFTPDDWTGTSSAGTRLTCAGGVWTLTYPKGGTTYTYTDETLDSECCMSSDSADWTSSNGVSISTITKDPV